MLDCYIRRQENLILDCSLNRIDLCFIAKSWVYSEDDVTELSVLKDFGYKINVVDSENRTEYV